MACATSPTVPLCVAAELGDISRPLTRPTRRNRISILRLMRAPHRLDILGEMRVLWIVCELLGFVIDLEGLAIHLFHALVDDALNSVCERLQATGGEGEH